MFADTSKIISSLYSNLYINQPYLKALKLDKDSFLNMVKGNKDRGLLEDILDKAIEDIKAKRASRFKQYLEREKKMIMHLDSLKEMNLLPILVNSYSLSTHGKFIGIDPYSNKNVFTNVLDDLLKRYDNRFVKQLAFIFVSPVTYISLFDNHLFDFSSKFGYSLRKSHTPNPVHSEYSKNLFSNDSKEDLYSAYLNRQILALKYGYILNSLLSSRDVLKEHNIFGFPLFMEKTSESKKILDYASKYFDLRYHMIGKSILTKISNRGITSLEALNRLKGFLDSISESNPEFNFKPYLVKDSKIAYRSKGFILLENDTFVKHPNLYDFLMSKYKDEVSLLRDFLSKYGLGVSRIEPRLVELMTQDHEVFFGLRSLNKANGSWLNEIKDKKIVFPDDINFQNIPEVSNKKAMIRGSEFSLPTNPKLTPKFVEEFYNSGNVFAGCTLDKIIATTHHFENDRAKIGTIIHDLISGTFPNLVHYDTLSKIAKPRPSSAYCETPFSFIYQGVAVSFHPDAYFFLNKGNAMDVVVIDTKTNSYRPYFEHKYLLQTSFYGMMLKHLLEKNYNYEVHNIYVVLNKMAFYNDDSNSNNYRKQKFSAIVKLDSTIEDIVNSFIHRIAFEKEQLKDPEKARVYRKKMEDLGVCKKCYEEHRSLCMKI